MRLGPEVVVQSGQWLQLVWTGDWTEQSIMAKELLPTVFAVAVWEELWAEKKI